MAEKPATQQVWHHSPQEGARVRIATETAFDLLAVTNQQRALSPELPPAERGLPADVVSLTQKCSSCRKIAAGVWNQERANLITQLNRPQPKRQPGAQTRSMGSLVPLNWPIQKKTAPPLKEWTRIIRIRLSFGGDLVGRPWGVELTQVAGIGVSIRQSNGNSFRQSLQLNIWGTPQDVEAAKTWATSLGAHWELLSVGVAA
jgi:hypothetical protein